MWVRQDPDVDSTPQDNGQADGRVRLDVVVSAGILATVILGNLAWHASDLDILAVLGTR